MSAIKNTASDIRKHKVESEGYASVKIFRNDEFIRELDVRYITCYPDQLSIGDAAGGHGVFVSYPEAVSRGDYTFDYIGNQASSEPYEGFMWYSYESRTFRVYGAFNVIASNEGLHQVFQGNMTYKDSSDVMRVEVAGEVENTLV